MRMTVTRTAWSRVVRTVHNHPKVLLSTDDGDIFIMAVGDRDGQFDGQGLDGPVRVTITVEPQPKEPTP